MVNLLIKKTLIYTPVICLIASMLMLLSVYILEYIVGLIPCEMCLWQRWPHIFSSIFCILSIIILSRYSNLLIFFAGIAYLVSSFIGIWHSGYEIGILPGPNSCVNNNNSLQMNFDEILNQPVISCQDVLWSFLGISLAGWNAILSILLTILCFLSLINKKVNNESKQ